jgi:AcrR family transcriptional regulator
MVTDMKEDNIRNLILEKAGAQFFQYGFTNTTTQQIAEELEISKKTLYKYFNSKEEMLFAVLAMYHQEMLCRIEALTKDTQMDFLEKLREISTLIGKYKAKFTPQLIRDLKKMAPEQFGHKGPPHQQLIPFIEQLLGEGIQKGMIRADVDLRLIMLVISRAFENLLSSEVLSELPFTFHEVLEAIIKIISEGILTEKARQKI